VLDRMEGTPALMASLLYGAGLRLLECACLRVKDLECVFRSHPGTRSNLTRAPVPTRPGQPFQRHPGTRSNLTRAAVPTAPGRPLR
jgi:hypothetical protein